MGYNLRLTLRMAWSQKLLSRQKGWLELNDGHLAEFQIFMSLFKTYEIWLLTTHEVWQAENGKFYKHQLYLIMRSEESILTMKWTSGAPCNRFWIQCRPLVFYDTATDCYRWILNFRNLKNLFIATSITVNSLKIKTYWSRRKKILVLAILSARIYYIFEHQ